MDSARFLSDSRSACMRAENLLWREEPVLLSTTPYLRNRELQSDFHRQVDIKTDPQVALYKRELRQTYKLDLYCNSLSKKIQI